MARITTRCDFREYVLKKLGKPLLDLVIDTGEIEDCATTGTTGTTGTATTGSSGTCDITLDLHSQLDLAVDDALDYFQLNGANVGNEISHLFIVLEEGVSKYEVPESVIGAKQPFSNGSLVSTFDSEEAASAVGLFSFSSMFGPRGMGSFMMGGSSDALLTYEIAAQYMSLVDMRYSKKFQIQFNDLSKEILMYPTPLARDIDKVIVMETTTKVDDVKCYNHIWLQRYAVALAAEQIGTNLSMYDGAQLPGGMTFNAGFYLEKGQREKEQLEDDLMMGKYGTEFAGGVMMVG